jgi:hypothetical protein
MFKPQIILQSNINHSNRQSNKAPALVADLGLITASADLIVVCKINVEDKFFREGAEGGFGEDFPVAGIGAVDWADFETGRV